MRWSAPSRFFVSDEVGLIDIAWVHGWLSTHAYWAMGRPLEVVANSVGNSLSLGLYSPDCRQVGFARFVTDRATFAYLCDVFVDPECQQRGLGSFLVETATSHPAVANLQIVLATAPGRTLYRRYGFAPLARPERWMERHGLP